MQTKQCSEKMRRQIRQGWEKCDRYFLMFTFLTLYALQQRLRRGGLIKLVRAQLLQEATAQPSSRYGKTAWDHQNGSGEACRGKVGLGRKVLGKFRGTFGRRKTK